MKTLDEFKQAGGVLTGGKHGTREEYEGQPRKYNDKLSTTFEKLGLGHSHDSTGSATGTTTGTQSHHHHPTDSGVSGVGDDYNSRGGLRGEGLNSTSGRHTTGGDGLRGESLNSTSGRHTTGGDNYSNNQLRDEGSGVGSRRPVGGNGIGDKQAYNDSGKNTGTGAKPSLMDRLNPRKDADGDGKAGIGD